MDTEASTASTSRVGHRAVAFMDLLGFRHLVRRDTELSLELLKNYSNSVHDHLSATVSQLPASIDFLVPMSDSIVVVSRNCGDLVRFVARLTQECYRYTANVRNSPNEYPLTLFRSAISYGECLPVRQVAIHKAQRGHSWNFVGPAVVEAVQAEKLGRGPRIFCTPQAVAQTPSPDDLLCAHDSIVEVLWPALGIFGPDGSVELSKLFGYLDDSVRLLRIYQGTDFEEHYREFLRLVVRSFCARSPVDYATQARLRERAIGSGVAAHVADLWQ